MTTCPKWAGNFIFLDLMPVSQKPFWVLTLFSPGMAEVAPSLDPSHPRNSPCLTGIHEAEKCRLMSETWDSCPYLRVLSPAPADVRKIWSLSLKLLSAANVTFVFLTPQKPSIYSSTVYCQGYNVHDYETPTHTFNVKANVHTSSSSCWRGPPPEKQNKELLANVS